MQLRITQTSLFLAAAMTLAVIFGVSALAQGNSDVGVWKLNLAKSKYSGGAPPKSATTKIEPSGSGIKATIDSIQADGSVRHWEFSANSDGKDNPITGNSQWGDMVARTRVDPDTVRSVYKSKGKVTATQTSVVSGDGKTRTVTTKGTNALGQVVDNVQFYDKQ